MQVTVTLVPTAYRVVLGDSRRYFGVCATEHLTSLEPRDGDILGVVVVGGRLEVAFASDDVM